jgi:hypothetical protein
VVAHRTHRRAQSSLIEPGTFESRITNNLNLPIGAHYTTRFEDNFTSTRHGFERCSESAAKPGANHTTRISGATTTPTAGIMRGMSHRHWTAGDITILQKLPTHGSSSEKCQKRAGYHDRVQRRAVQSRGTDGRVQRKSKSRQTARRRTPTDPYTIAARFAPETGQLHTAAGHTPHT